MPPEILAPRFSGLRLVDDPDEGEFTDLIKADNVRLDRSGALVSRPGIRFFARGPALDNTVWSDLNPDPTQQRTFFNGELRLNDGKVFQCFNSEPIADPNGGGQFFWSNTLGTNEVSVVSAGATSPGGLNDLFGTGQTKRFAACKVPGAQYNEELILPSGHRFRQLSGGQIEISAVTGFPAFFDGWGSMCTHKDRIFAAPKLVGSAGNVPARLYFSTEGNALSWPSTNFFDIGSGTEDGAITAIVPFQGRLIILKTGGMWIMETTGLPTSWSLRKYDDRGAVGQLGFQHTTGLYWIGSTGAYRWDGAEITDISEPIKTLFDGDSVIDSLNSSGCIYEDKIYFWVRKSDASKRIFIYDILLDAWTEIVTPLEGLGYFITNFFARPKKARYIRTFVSGFQSNYTEDYGPPGVFVTVTDTGNRPQVYSMLDTNAGSDATMLAVGPPTTYIERGMALDIQTKFSDFEEPIQLKRVHRWEMEWSGPTTTMTQKDEAGRTRSDVVTGAAAALTRVGGLGHFRKISLRWQTSSLAATQFRLKRIWAKVSVRGREIKSEAGQYA